MDGSAFQRMALRSALSMATGRRWLGRFAVCGILLSAGRALCGSASAQPAQTPAFIEAPCDLPNVPARLRPRLQCGTVNVPRDYGHPDAERFALAVAVVRSEQQPALPDPLLYVSGGPGGPLTIYAAYQGAHPFAPGRDLILVDQRGTGRSEPHFCPDLRDDFVNALAEVALGPEVPMRARRRAIFTACRQQAAAQGIDLNDFGTSVTVEDFNSVRQALGVAQWNVFGVSYGTTVAMTLMARHPETVRAAVLDSVNPPDPLLPRYSSNVAEARRAFFSSCSRDEACAAEFPDLATTYQDALKRLDQAPLPVLLPAELHHPGNHGPLTASSFELVVGRLLYFPKFYPGLPRLITAVHDGDTTLFASSLADLLAQARDPDTGSNFAANAAVDCRDRPRYREPLGEGANIFEQISLYGMCDGWSELGPPPVVPLDTDVPTLVLAGQFDPNATPAASRHVTDLIGPHAQWIEFARSGHSVRAFSPCASKIVAEFVDQPARPLDTSCAGQPAPISFLPRR